MNANASTWSWKKRKPPKGMKMWKPLKGRRKRKPLKVEKFLPNPKGE